MLLPRGHQQRRMQQTGGFWVTWGGHGQGPPFCSFAESRDNAGDGVHRRGLQKAARGEKSLLVIADLPGWDLRLLWR